MFSPTGKYINLRALCEIESSMRSIYDESDFIIDSDIRNSSWFGIWKAKMGENKKINVEYQWISVYDFSFWNLTTVAFAHWLQNLTQVFTKMQDQENSRNIVRLDATVSSGLSIIYE